MSPNSTPGAPARALAHAIDHARHLLPAQGPIGEFVHHNTLHAYQHLPFHEALRRAAEDCDAEVYWSEDKFRAALRMGEFGPPNIEAALDERYQQEQDEPIGPLTRRTIERTMLLYDIIGARVPAGAVRDDASMVKLYLAAGSALEGVKLAPRLSESASVRTHRDLVCALGGTDPAASVNPVLVRFLGAYLDDGMSRWPMPNREAGLLACLRSYLGASRLMLSVAERRVLARLEATDADEVSIALSVLDELGVAQSDYESYVSRVMLELPGWSGMTAMLSGTTTVAREIVPRAFDELVAARLLLSVEVLRESCVDVGFHGSLGEFPPFALGHIANADPFESRAPVLLFEISRHLALTSDTLLRLGPEFARQVVTTVEAFDSVSRRRTFLAAMEHAHLHAIVSAVADNRDRPAQRESVNPRFQVMFCIDDREEGIRRHFEEFDPRHVTFGVAGFFGIAMNYTSFEDPNEKPLCPVVVTPAHAVVERARETAGDAGERHLRLRRLHAQAQLEIADASRSFLRGLFVTPLLGLLSIGPLAFRILFPHEADRVVRWLRNWLLPEVPTDISVERVVDPEIDDEGARAEAGYLFEGFTLDERADRVASTLENIGLVKAFGSLVTVLGHSASTVNNPHHSAYDCGACGGRSGGPNARAYAMMANDPAVRTRLAVRGITIPNRTWFIGGLHDTTTDGIVLFDLDRVPDTLQAELAALRKSLDAARARSAHERCRRFEHAPKYLGAKQALRHVEERAVDLSQARPELGHATNAVCIVGRRAISRGIFLDRRAFLTSYDPTVDLDAKILQRILTAVVPVGAGINLEYYFSTVDPERWGCGTKLPHNLSGLIGVMAGASGDLRTGLPREMIEVHEPVRLLCIVDASTSALLKVASHVPEVAEFVGNGWVRLVSIDPETGATEVFRDGSFAPLDLRGDPQLPIVKSAVDWYRGHRESLPPARIVPSSSFGDGGPCISSS